MTKVSRVVRTEIGSMLVGRVVFFFFFLQQIDV